MAQVCYIEGVTDASYTARRSPRFPAFLAMSYQSDSLELTGTVEDLSVGGAFVQSDAWDMPGTEAELSLSYPLWKHTLRVPCTVVHTTDDPEPGMGVKFTNESVVEPIRQYCSRLSYGRPIIMVDDDPMILRTLERQLAASGLPMVGINLPVKTEDSVARFKPQCVVLDVNMPGLDGFTLARRLRSNPATRALPLAFFSASDASQVPPDLVSIPFVQKPDVGGQLIRAVQQLTAPAHVPA